MTQEAAGTMNRRVPGWGVHLQPRAHGSLSQPGVTEFLPRVGRHRATETHMGFTPELTG